MKRLVLYVMLFLIPQSGFSQTDAEKKEARQLAIKAIEVMDNGQIDQAIEMLNQCMRLDPQSISYPYEIGYAYYMKEDYVKAIEIFESLTDRKEFDAQCFQMLGNAYDLNNQREKAIKTYQKGLDRFPKSGRLYLELGNIERSKNNMSDAIKWYEDGIAADPAFPSNYYWASRIFCNSEEVIWGVLYGEIFMNLERGSDRTAEISELLYDTYAEHIRFQSDTTVVQFSSNIVITGKSDKIPFPINFELTMLYATGSEDTLDLGSLSRIRARFIEFFYEKGFSEKYDNVLFSWHRDLMQKNQFECYNYWLFMQGSYHEFAEWVQNNKTLYDNFLNWFSKNPMTVNEKKPFLRTGI